MLWYYILYNVTMVSDITKELCLHSGADDTAAYSVSFDVLHVSMLVYIRPCHIALCSAMVYGLMLYYITCYDVKLPFGYIHIYVYTCMTLYVYTYIYTQKDKNTYMYTHTHIYIYTYILYSCIHIHMNLCIYIYVVCIYIYALYIYT